MRGGRWRRMMTGLVTGALLLQVGGCNSTAFNETLQTIFLGINAVASLEILDSGSFDFSLF